MLVTAFLVLELGLACECGAHAAAAAPGGMARYTSPG